MFQRILLSFVIIFYSTYLYAENLEMNSIVLEANEAPPFWSKVLPHNGMAGEIIYEISKACAINTTIIFKPLSRLIEDDTNNDLGNPAFFIDNQDFKQIIPIALYNISLYRYSNSNSNSNSNTIKSIDELVGKSVGLIKGALIDSTYFKEKGIDFEESYSHQSLFKKLKLGRIDYVIEIDLVSQQTIRKLFPLEVDNFIQIPIQRFSNPIAIMLAHEQENVDYIANKYREGLKKIIENGVYEKILKKYSNKRFVKADLLKNLQRYNLLYYVEDEE